MESKVESPAIKINSQKSFPLIIFFVVTLLLVTVFSFLRFYIFKNYDMTLEVPCDPSSKTCFTRSCEDGECPPNNLENYSQYIIKAFQFDKCEGQNICADFCKNAENCEEIACDAEAGDSCSSQTEVLEVTEVIEEKTNNTVE